MPITNNLIQIDGVALRPAPKFNLSYETFKSGDYIIGGLLKITINGEIYGSSDTDLLNKIKSLSAYSGTCRSVYIFCDESILVDGDGFIRSISFNPTDQPFFVTYSIDIELSTNNNVLTVQRDAAFSTLYGLTIPNDVNLKSYEESLSVVSDESLSNTAIYAGDSYTKAALKMNGQISIQAHHHMCDTFSSPDLIAKLYSIVNNRITNILSMNSYLSTTYPALDSYFNNGYTAINDTKKVTINKFDNKIDITFDIYLVTGSCHPKAIVDLTISENTDQTTGLSGWSVKGSIKGLSDGSTQSLDNNVTNTTRYSNAIAAYNDLENQTISREYNGFEIFGCLTAASLPANTCYQRISSQITENFQGGEINFDMAYGDIESCQIGGTTIDINIQEEYSTYKYVEHIIPGRGTALVQIGSNRTPFKATITASGKVNTCDSSLVASLEGCVRDRLETTITAKGYDGANYILAKESETTGKYTYKITRSYIECPSI
jgi:hypothetical protein